MNQFARALRTLGAACMEAASILESSNQPQTAPEPRKRGRPKKTVSEPILSGSIVSNLLTCELCGRQIPSDALSIHHINCAAAQAGYWDQK